MKTLSKFVDKFAWGIVAASVAITIAMIPGIKKIQLSKGLDPNSFPAFNTLIQDMKAVRGTFGENSRQVVFSVEAEGNLKVSDYRVIELIQGLTQDLKSSPAIKRQSILSLTTVKNITSEGDDISSQTIYKTLPKTAAEVDELETKLKNDPFYYGRLVSKDFKATLILATAFDGQELAEIHFAMQKIVDGRNGQVPGAKVTILGDPELVYQIESNIGSDVNIFAGLCLGLIFLSFFGVFRSWRGVFIPLIGMTMSIIWTMGAVGFYGEPITILSTTIPIMLVVAGVEYVLHIYHHLIEGFKKGHRFSQIMEETANASYGPLSAATLMNVIGSITLLTFAIRPIQHFGIFMAVGSCTMLIVSFFVIPSLFKVFHRHLKKIEETVGHGVMEATSIANQTIQGVPVVGAALGEMVGPVAGAVKDGVKGASKGFISGINASNPIDRVLSFLSHLVIRYPIAILLTTVALMGWGVWESRNIEIGYNNIALLPKDSHIRQATVRLDKSFGGTTAFEIMIDAGKKDGILSPELLKKVDQYENEMRKIDGISHTFSVVHLLKRVNDLLASDKNANGGLPESEGAVSQYLFVLSMNDTGMPLSQLITSDHSKIKIKVTTSFHDTKETALVHDQLQSMANSIFDAPTRARIGGDLVVNIAVMRYLVWGKIQNILSSILTMFLVLVILYRSLTRSFYSIIPIFVQCTLNFGLMGWLHIRLDFITAIITSLAMGLGVDFGIHAIEGLKEKFQKSGNLNTAIRDAIRGPGRLQLYTALCNVAGFMALMASKFSAIHTFALLMSFNMIALFLSSLLIIPATVRLFPPEFMTERLKRNGLRENKKARAFKLAATGAFVLVLSLGCFWLEAKAESPKKVEPTVQEILEKSKQAVYTKNEEAIYVMKLIGASGEENVRKMKVWFRSDNDKDAKLLVKFSEPADIRGTGMLSIVEKDKEPDQWIFLPAIKKVRRIKGGSRNESFLGSDFSMSDMAIDKSNPQYEYTLAGSEKCNGGKDCWKILGLPRKDANPDDLAYSKKELFVQKENNIVPESKFYNPAGQLEKVMTLEGIRKDGNRWVVDRMKMENILTKTKTIIEVEKRDNSKVPPASNFTQSYLEKN